MIEPCIAAHRAGLARFPENGLAAIRAACALPIEQIELDVHLSADDRPVVLHDATLDRTTTGSGPVRARSMAELASLRLHDGTAVPLLSDVVPILRDAGKLLRLELKTAADGKPYPGLLEACLEVLDRYAMRPRTVAIAFAPRVVAAASQAGFAGVALLFTAGAWRGLGPELAAGLCRAVGAAELGLPFSECDTPAEVAAIRATGLRLGAWGLDDAGTIARGRALGLDVITTDDPWAAVAARATAAA